jgi:hypothetical protein
MSAGPTQQQSRLLPYLLAVLVVLLGYVVYTRVLSPGRPAPVVVTTPPPVAASPAPAPSPEPTPTAAATPAPAASPGPGVTAVPTLPSGRPNPFAALVTEQAARPAPPPPPPVPPPFFPGRPGEGPGTRPRAGTKLAGVLVKDGESLAIVQLAQTTYIVAEGDVVEQFRVARIEPERVVLRSGTQELSLELGGERGEAQPRR